MMLSALNSNTHEKNWLELPSDVTANILKRVGMSDILQNVENVCTAWRKICTDDPTMWRVMDMEDLYLMDSFVLDPIEERCKRLVDRSQGQLVDITIVDAYSDKLLLYVAQRSSQLRRLVIARGYYHIGRSLTEALVKFPLLEELSLYYIEISKEVIESAAHNCPMLRTLKLNQKGFNEWPLTSDNWIASAIGENFRELRHLEIIGNNMSNSGLEAILDACRHLETLDLRQCFYIDLEGDLEKRCFKQIKVLKLPQECLESLEYYYESEEEEEDDDFYYVGSPDLYDGYFSF